MGYCIVFTSYCEWSK